MNSPVPLTTLAIAASLVFVVVVIVWLARAPDAKESPPSVHEVVPSLEDNERQIKMVTLDSVDGKGLGVRAVEDIPQWTCLGPYPGKVYTMKDHMALKLQGAVDDQYAIEFWDSTPGGPIREGLVVNPMLDGRSLPDRYMCAAPFVNEPGPEGTPNLAWVWNFPKHRVEMWTTRDVNKGEELTICYGQAYPRHYKSNCTQPGVEAPRLAIGHEGDLPKEWHLVVGADNTAPGARS